MLFYQRLAVGCLYLSRLGPYMSKVRNSSTMTGFTWRPDQLPSGPLAVQTHNLIEKFTDRPSCASLWAKPWQCIRGGDGGISCYQVSIPSTSDRSQTKISILSLSI